MRRPRNTPSRRAPATVLLVVAAGARRGLGAAQARAGALGRRRVGARRPPGPHAGDASGPGRRPRVAHRCDARGRAGGGAGRRRSARRGRSLGAAASRPSRSPARASRSLGASRTGGRRSRRASGLPEGAPTTVELVAATELLIAIATEAAPRRPGVRRPRRAVAGGLVVVRRRLRRRRGRGRQRARGAAGAGEHGAPACPRARCSRAASRASSAPGGGNRTSTGAYHRSLPERPRSTSSRTPPAGRARPRPTRSVSSPGSAATCPNCASPLPCTRSAWCARSARGSPQARRTKRSSGASATRCPPRPMRAAEAARDAAAAYARPAVRRAAGATYDAYLRAQGLDAGLADYGRAGVLVVAVLARCDRHRRRAAVPGRRATLIGAAAAVTDVDAARARAAAPRRGAPPRLAARRRQAARGRRAEVAPHQRLGIGVAPHELAEHRVSVDRVATSQDRRHEGAPGGRVEHAGLFEATERVGFERLAPLVAVVARGVATGKDVAEAAQEAGARVFGPQGERRHRRLGEGDRVVLRVRLELGVEREVDGGVRELPELRPRFAEAPRGDHPLEQRFGHRRAGLVVARVERDALAGPGPVLEDLRRDLDEVPRNGGGPAGAHFDARQQVVEQVPVLVEHGAHLVRDEQGRRAVVRRRQVALDDADVWIEAAVRARAAVDEPVHPRTATLAFPGEPVGVEGAELGAVLGRRRVGADARVPDVDVGRRGDRHPEEAVHQLEDALLDPIEREVRAQLLLIEAVALAPHPLEGEADIPRLEPIDAQVLARERLDAGQLRIDVRAGALGELGDEGPRLHGVADHALLEHEVGERRVPEPPGELAPLAQDRRDHGTVVERSAVGPLQVGAPQELARRSMLPVGEERQVARRLKREAPALDPLGPGLRGRALDHGRREARELGGVAHDPLEGVRRVEHVLCERRRELRELDAQLLHDRALVARQVGTSAAEGAQRLVQVPSPQRVEGRGLRRLGERGQRRPQAGMRGDRAPELLVARLHLMLRRPQLGRGRDRRQVVDRAVHPVERFEEVVERLDRVRVGAHRLGDQGVERALGACERHVDRRHDVVDAHGAPATERRGVEQRGLGSG